MSLPIYRTESSRLMGDGVALPPRDAIYSLFNSDDLPTEQQKGLLDTDRQRRNGNTVTESPSALLNQHQTELARYRETVHLQAEEILTLRRRLRDLENSNADLRRDLNGFNQLSRVPVETEAETELLDKKQLAVKYNSLVSRLARQTVEVNDYRQKVQFLQEELMRKNKETKDFLIQTSKKREGEEGGSVREMELEERLAARTKKVRLLEELVRNQQKSINKMEKILSAKDHKNGSEKKQPRIDGEGLTEENDRLRKALQELSNLSRTMDRGLNQDDSQDLLTMHEKLGRAESRIGSLENQIQVNAKQWAHERSDLILRLNESERGLQRPSSNTLHNPWAPHDRPGSGYNQPRVFYDGPGRKRELAGTHYDSLDSRRQYTPTKTSPHLTQRRRSFDGDRYSILPDIQGLYEPESV